METITLTIEDLAKLQAGVALAVLRTIGFPSRIDDYNKSFEMCLKDLHKDGYQFQLLDFNTHLNVESN